MSMKFNTRRAIESVLIAAVTDAEIFVPGTEIPSIEWPDLEFDRKKTVEFFRFSIHFDKTDPLEIGLHPLTENAGFAKIGVFTLAGAGQDRNDVLAGIVEAAYPYGSTLEFDGTTVFVDKVDHGDFVPSDPAWSYSNVDVFWNTYRRL